MNPQHTLVEHKTETLTTRSGRPIAVKLLVVFPLLLTVCSIPPGIMLLQDPSGASIGLQFVLPHLTQVIPFVHDFAPVGVWLITIYGIAPIILALGVWILKRWARYESTILGATVVTWIGSELVMFYSLGFTFFYPLIGGIGLAILALSLTPSVRHSLLVSQVQ